MDTRRKVSGVLFILALAAFFLPWATVSCQGVPMVELRGTDMVFGQEVQGEQVGQDIYAILAGIAGVVGSILLFAAGSQGPMLRGIAGVLGAACLVVLQIKANSDLKAQGQGVTIEYQIGYWLALLFFIGAALANYIPLGQEGEEDQGRSPP